MAVALSSAGADASGAVAAGRKPRALDFVRLKMRIMRNGFRGQPWRVVAFLGGGFLGLAMASLVGLALLGSAAASREASFVVACLAGGAVVVGWTVIPLLFFGVDETLDPARFALLPVPRMTLARGMLAAAFVGVPAAATLVATSGLVFAAWLRFGLAAGGVALVGIVLGLVLGVIASRAITSAFAALLRSRRVRDLAAVTIAVLASSIGPLQLAISSQARHGTITQALRLAEIVSWTPLAAPYAVPYDVAAGHWLALAVRLGMTVSVIVLLLWWWSRTIESAMLGVASGAGPNSGSRRSAAAGPVTSLIPRLLRGVVPASTFGAIVARESRFWWRDPRRRASLVSILMASAVLPIALNFAPAAASSSSRGLAALPFSFAVTMSGTMGGMLLGNQFAFDGNAYAAHLLGHVPGRVELRARAIAVAVVAVPVQVAVVAAVTLLTGAGSRIGVGLGMLAAGFGSAIAAAALLSVLAPYALPENTNPFALNAGGGSAKGMLALVAMVGTLAFCMPVVVAANLLAGASVGVWAVLALGLVYGAGAAWIGTYIAGDLLDRRGPEVLVAITPRR